MDNFDISNVLYASNASGTLSVEGFGMIFADALAEVVFKLTGFSFDALPIGSGHNIEFDGMIGGMSLKGDKKSGMIFISAGESDLKILCSFMTGISQDKITDDDMCDALCELVNMTAGNAKLRISDPDYMFALSWPFAINGENISIITKKRVNVVSKVLGDGEIAVKLKVVY